MTSTLPFVIEDDSDEPASEEDICEAFRSAATRDDHEVSPVQGNSVIPSNPRDRSKTSKGTPLPTKTVDELLSDPESSAGIQWLVDGLIPVGSFIIVYGPGKVGKTTFLSHLAAKLIAGAPFLGRDVTASNVLWIDLEQHVSLTSRLLGEVDAYDKPFDVHVYSGIAPKVQDIEASILATSASAVIVDSLSKLLELRDENDASEVNRSLTKVLNVVRSTNATVIAIHHDRKRESSTPGRSLRGSSVFLSALDGGISIKQEGASGDNRRRLDFVSRYVENNGLTLTVRLAEDGYVAEGDGEEVTLNDLLAKLGEKELVIEEWAALAKRTRNAIRPTVDRLVSQGLVVREGRGVKGSPYRYKSANRDSGSAAVSLVSTEIESQAAASSVTV